MFSKKDRSSEKKSGDYELLLGAIDRLIEGDFNTIDAGIFADTAVGNKVNELIHSFKKSNNAYVMRLNDAMKTIGDNSYVKNMLDQVNLQTSSIYEMEESSRNLESSIVDISSSVAHMKDNAYEVMKASEQSEVNMNESIKAVNESSEEIEKINQQVQIFREKINKISEIIVIVKKIASQSNLLALNASIEAARAGEAGKGFAVVADQVRQLSSNTSTSAEDIVKTVTELQISIGELAKAMDDTTGKLASGNQKVEQSVKDIQLINKQINTISEEIESIYSAVDTQSAVTREFGTQIQKMSENYTELSNDCQAAGQHMFKSGRLIDTTRSDMFRGHTAVTYLDNLKVFQVDHFILTWRVYNNAVGFEQLKITQLNDPTACKLGKWIGSQTDERITGSQAFKDLRRCHEELHSHAVDSFKAKENGNVDMAIHHFGLVLDAYYKYEKAIARLREVYISLGYVEETPIHIE